MDGFQVICWQIEELLYWSIPFLGYKVLLSINMPTFGLNQYERIACLDGYAYSLYHFHQATVKMSIRIRRLNFVKLSKTFPDQRTTEKVILCLGIPHCGAPDGTSPSIRVFAAATID